MIKKTIDLGERGNYHTNNKLNNLTGKEWVKFTKSWEIFDIRDEKDFFIINPKRRNEDVILHPAKYPEELVKKIIGFFTKENQIVIDPFLGTGSTLVAAQESGRRGIGVELMKKYAEISRSRLRSQLNNRQFVLEGDSTNIEELRSEIGQSIAQILAQLGSEKADLLVTSPPYWDMLNKSRGNIISSHKKHIASGGDSHYSNLKEDVGNFKDYEQYMNSLVTIIDGSCNFLKSGGYLVVVIQNIRTSSGEMKPVAWDLAIRLSKKYVLKQEKLWLQDNKMLNCWGYPSCYVSNVHHHYCIVLQKP